MTNAWPSPSFSSDSPSPSDFMAGWHIVLALPCRLWDAYVAYLWHYQPSSWVGRVASTLRILAVVLVLPVVLLTLLDVTSYVIARTLGVVDDVKASTSDADTAARERRAGVAVPVSACVPTILLPEAPARGSEGLASEDSVEGQAGGDGDGDGGGGGHGHGHGGGGGYEGGDECVSSADVRDVSATVHARAQARAAVQGWDQTQMQMETQGESGTHASDASLKAYYFAGEENSRLAGEGMFSPAVSAPSSPLTPMHTFADSDGRGSGQVSEEEGVALRRRVWGARENEHAHT